VVVFEMESGGVGVDLQRGFPRREGCGERDHCFGVGNRKLGDEELGRELVSCSLGFNLLSMHQDTGSKETDF